MSHLRRTMGTTGAAALLVLAAFTAGASSTPAAVGLSGHAASGSDSSSTSDASDRDDLPDATTGDVTVNAVPGPGAAELQYVPIAPCRVVDTRNGTGSGATPLGNNTSRSYYVAGTNGFTAQGGKPGGCGIPESAQAVSATMLAYTPSHAGRLRAWPFGTSEPNIVSLYYGSSSTTTGATLNLTPGAGRDLTVRNNNATTELLLDITGYYVPQLYAYVSPSGAFIDQSGRATSVTQTGTGTYTIVWDRDISSCVGVGSSDLSGYIVSVYTSGTSSYVYVYNNAGSPSNYWINVTITC